MGEPAAAEQDGERSPHEPAPECEAEAQEREPGHPRDPPLGRAHQPVQHVAPVELPERQHVEHRDEQPQPAGKGERMQQDGPLARKQPPGAGHDQRIPEIQRRTPKHDQLRRVDLPGGEGPGQQKAGDQDDARHHEPRPRPRRAHVE